MNGTTNIKNQQRHQIQLLTAHEQMEVERNHDLVYSFLHRHGYSIEDYYNIAIWGYLKGVQVYCRRQELQNKYSLEFVCNQYMRAEISNYRKVENAKKRKPAEIILSLDAEYAEEENLYNCVGGKSLEAEYMEAEHLKELLEKLSIIQRKIAELKMEGYSNREVFLILEIKPSTYYKELQRIKKVLLEIA